MSRRAQYTQKSQFQSTPWEQTSGLQESRGYCKSAVSIFSELHRAGALYSGSLEVSYSCTY